MGKDVSGDCGGDDARESGVAVGGVVMVELMACMECVGAA